jgi:hypothetical protein
MRRGAARRAGSRVRPCYYIAPASFLDVDCLIRTGESATAAAHDQRRDASREQHGRDGDAGADTCIAPVERVRRAGRHGLPAPVQHVVRPWIEAAVRSGRHDSRGRGRYGERGECDYEREDLQRAGCSVWRAACFPFLCD